MPWKLLFFLALIALVVAFAGFNLGNSSDISFGFYEFQDLPIFISLFSAFFLGVTLTLPFTYLKYLRKKGKPPREKIGKELKATNETNPRKTPRLGAGLFGKKKTGNEIAGTDNAEITDKEQNS